MPDLSVARLAVLIDADNTSASHAAAMLEEVARYGVPTVKRAYGDWTTQQLVGWKKALNQHAIQPVQQFAYTQGKNSTDSALIIDAMDLLYSGNLEAFALVSSDSDFTRLATRLRESGKTVYGLGRRRTPPSLVAACDKFIFLEVLDRGDASDPEPETGADTGPGQQRDSDGGRGRSAEPETPLPDLQKLLTSAIDATSGEDGWAHLGSVGSYLGTRQSSFDPRNYGFGKLVSLARAQEYVEVQQTEDNATRVRLVEQAPPPPKVTSRTRSTAKRTAKKS